MIPPSVEVRRHQARVKVRREDRGVTLVLIMVSLIMVSLALYGAVSLVLVLR